MSTSTNSKMAGDKVLRNVTDLTTINGADNAFGMSKVEKELLGLADGIKGADKVTTAPVESKGWETALVSRTKPKVTLSKIMKTYKAHPGRNSTYNRVDAKRDIARREDAIAHRRGWDLAKLETFCATATESQLEALEEIIEDAVLADLEGEDDACRIFAWSKGEREA